MVGGRPAEVRDRGADHHRGVGDATGDDDVGARVQCRRDAEPTQVGVGREGSLGDAELLAIERMSSPSTWATAGSSPSPFATSRSRAASAAGLRPPALLTIFTPRSRARPRRVLDLRHERSCVAEVGVLHRVLAEDQHGQLGQVVAGEDVERSTVRAALEHLAHRREAVAVEAGAVADQQRGLARLGIAASRPGPDGPGEALGDVEPGVDTGAVGHQVGVGAVDPLGDQQAEVVGRAGQPLGGVVRPPRPHLAAGRRELDAHLGVGHVESVVDEGVAAGAHADVGDVLDAVGDLGLDVQGLVDVQRVRPSLHEARGHHRGGRHRRAEPRHLLPRGKRAERVASAARAASQRVSSSSAGRPASSSAPVSTKPVGSAMAASTIASQDAWSTCARAAAVAVSSVQSRCATWVATVQPACRGGARPLGVVEDGDGGAQPVSFGGEVGQQVVEQVPCVSHGASFSRASRTSAHWSRIRERRRVSSVIVEARPSPRTRSRVAWTSSRTPGWRLVGPEQLDGHSVGLAADPLLEGGDAPRAGSRRCAPPPRARGPR